MKHKYIILSIILITLCVAFLGIKGINTQDEQENITTSLVEPYSVYVIDSQTPKTTFTAYSLSIDETDENPCIGSHNNNLCELQPEFKDKSIRICASRDLPLDTIIYIDGFGECIIKDRMNKRYLRTNRVDILFNNKQEAINFGIRKLKYVIVK